MEQGLPTVFWMQEILAVLIILLAILLTIFNLPGNTLLVIGYLGYVLLDGPRYLNMHTAMLMILLYALGEIWDFCISYLGIKRENISWIAVGLIGVGTLIGTIAGTAFLPILGSVIGGAAGAFIMAYVYQYWCTRSTDQARMLAWKAARNQFIALIGKLVVTVLIACIFAKQIFSGMEI